MKRNKAAVVIWMLILIILILVIIMLYIFLVQPAIAENQTAKAQEQAQQGYEFAIVSVMQAAAQCQQAVPLTYNNETVYLVNAECPQIQACLQ